MDFTSADPLFVAGTYGFLDFVNGAFLLDPAIKFDLPFVTYWGLPITERFSWGTNNLIATALPPTISIDTYSGSVHEYADSISVTLSRSGADLGLASTVFLSTEDGAAVSSGVDKDFNAVLNREIIFAPGQTSVTVTLNSIVINDTRQEVNENFHIRLSGPTNASLGFSTGDITIIDNDITGTSWADILSGSIGNDSFSGGASNDVIDGGAGLDTAIYSGNRANFTIATSGTDYIVTDITGVNGTDTLTNVERLIFTDTKISLDYTGNSNAGFDLAGLANAGQVYRLYQAAFNRTPDIGGITYWVGQADSNTPLTTIASGFTGSVEFNNTYGNLTNHQFVDQLYQNVLHRAGDAGGVTYWYSQIDSYTQTREQILVGFAESNENQAALIGVIQNGITLNLI